MQRGAILVRLDPALLRSQYEQSRAQAAQAAERLRELENGSLETEIARAQAQSTAASDAYRQSVAQTAPRLAQQRSAVREAFAALTLSRQTYARTRSLAATGDVSRQSLDQATSALAQARSRLAQARAAYAELARAQLPYQRASTAAQALAESANFQTVKNGPRPEEIAQARAALAAAQARAAYDRARLDEAVIVAPAAGVVQSFNLHPGDLLGANQQAAIIDTFADPFVYIYASQRDLAALGPGAHLRVFPDSGGEALDGVVEAHDRQAQFTPQNVETVDQRADLVYGVKVRIHDAQHRLLDGTTVTVRPR